MRNHRFGASHPGSATECARAYAAEVAEQRSGWQTFGEKTIYDNRWVRLGLVDVRAPNGERWDYHVVHLGRIAVALIVDNQDRALMLWRYRFVTEQWGYELLGGLVDVGEDPAATAAREAEEESGWRAGGGGEASGEFRAASRAGHSAGRRLFVAGCRADRDRKVSRHHGGRGSREAMSLAAFLSAPATQAA